MTIYQRGAYFTPESYMEVHITLNHTFTIKYWARGNGDFFSINRARMEGDVDYMRFEFAQATLSALGVSYDIGNVADWV